jgi:hypothetical protein
MLTQDDKKKMLENGRQRVGAGDDDTRGLLPVVRLFTSDANCNFLLAALEADDPDVAYGLCDLGMGFPELCRIRVSELESLRGEEGKPVERDPGFRPDKTLAEYAAEARSSGRIEA